MDSYRSTRKKRQYRVDQNVQVITWTKSEAVRKNCYKYGRKEYGGMTDVIGYDSVEHMIMGNVKSGNEER